MRRSNSAVVQAPASKRARSIVDESTEMQTQSSVQSESQSSRPRNTEPATSASVSAAITPITLHKYIAFTGIGVAQQVCLQQLIVFVFLQADCWSGCSESINCRDRIAWRRDDRGESERSDHSRGGFELYH
jgi:hypothetical protein